MRFAGRCYRAHDPAWSFTPLSGTGAALTGGRFNRRGEPTLYLSLDVMTSFGEATQGFSRRLQPLTMCEYDIDCTPVADLRQEASRSAFGVSLSDLGCAWMIFSLSGKEAPSWRVADRLKAAGQVGMIVAQFRTRCCTVGGKPGFVEMGPRSAVQGGCLRPGRPSAEKSALLARRDVTRSHQCLSLSQKFFGSFFQKRTAFLPCATTPCTLV